MNCRVDVKVDYDGGLLLECRVTISGSTWIVEPYTLEDEILLASKVCAILKGF